MTMEVKGGTSPRCRAILLCALLGARAHTRVTAAPVQPESRQNTEATSHDQDLGCRSHRSCSAITSAHRGCQELEMLAVHRRAAWPRASEARTCSCVAERHSCLADCLGRSLSKEIQTALVVSSFAPISQVPNQRTKFLKDNKGMCVTQSNKRKTTQEYLAGSTAGEIFLS